tara:strand:+ start:1112 stop:1327 length:216 start_codon:yes stop_codon:yes gene_type:complete
MGITADPDIAWVTKGAAPIEASSRYFDDVWAIHHIDSDIVYNVGFKSRFGDINNWQRQVAKNIIFLRCVET